jgi:hypothetical protein
MVEVDPNTERIRQAGAGRHAQSDEHRGSNVPGAEGCGNASCVAQ